jgi:hypothetical protein
MEDTTGVWLSGGIRYPARWLRVVVEARADPIVLLARCFVATDTATGLEFTDVVAEVKGADDRWTPDSPMRGYLDGFCEWPGRALELGGRWEIVAPVTVHGRVRIRLHYGLAAMDIQRSVLTGEMEIPAPGPSPGIPAESFLTRVVEG